MKFKVGQIVELVDDSGMAAGVGATAVVTGVGTQYLSVKWIRNSLDDNQGNGGYCPHLFKVVSQKGKQLLFSFMEI